jgi:hypothetical protein
MGEATVGHFGVHPALLCFVLTLLFIKPVLAIGFLAGAVIYYDRYCAHPVSYKVVF